MKNKGLHFLDETLGIYSELRSLRDSLMKANTQSLFIKVEILESFLGKISIATQNNPSFKVLQ